VDSRRRTKRSKTKTAKAALHNEIFSPKNYKTTNYKNDNISETKLNVGCNSAAQWHNTRPIYLTSKVRILPLCHEREKCQKCPKYFDSKTCFFASK
jgi:hypothetical protein